MKQLGSLHKLSVSVIFLFTFLTSNGTDRYGLSAGAGEAGAGYSCLTRKSFWGSFRNQALLAENSSVSFGVNYDNRFNISQLGTRTAAVILPAHNVSLGAIYSSFGYSDFHRNMSAVACGLPLSEALSAGIQIDYYAEMVPGDYPDRHLISGEIGLIYRIKESTSLGFHIINPVPNSLRKNSMPATINISAGTALNNLLYAGASAEMTSGSDLLVRMGFEYEAAKSFWLRGGFCTENTSFSFGAGYLVKFAKIDIAFSSHDKLGITSSVSLIFNIK